MVSLLLVKGANVKAKDRKERTPLHLAAYMGMLSAYYKAVSTIVTHIIIVCDAHAQYTQKYSVFSLCFCTGHSECINILVGNHSEVNAVDNQVCTLYM